MKAFAWVVIILILVALVLIVFLYLESEDLSLNDVYKKVGNYFSGGEPEGDEGSSESSDAGGFSGSTGMVVGDIGSESGPSPSEFDVEKAECGFYFVEYRICGGTCPSGECVSEGRSCYCQN